MTTLRFTAAFATFAIFFAGASALVMATPQIIAAATALGHANSPIGALSLFAPLGAAAAMVMVGITAANAIMDRRI
jgi:cytochrome b